MMPCLCQLFLRMYGCVFFGMDESDSLSSPLYLRVAGTRPSAR